MAVILIVEDDTAIHSLMKETLELNDFETLSAYSGTEGELVLKHNEVDLILLDLMLPGIDGEQFLQHIRVYTTVPVIVVSAKNDQESKLALLTNGADDYMIKPFDVKELLARVHIQLRHTLPSKQLENVTYKNIHVDLDTREVTIDNQLLQLTGREYEILLLFLNNPQKVFSRANIYESVWGEPYFDSSKTVNMHISNLRTKIHEYDTSYVKTIWGIGFKFD